MKTYLAYCAMFGGAALVAASGVSELLFSSWRSFLLFVVYGVLPGALLVAACSRRGGAAELRPSVRDGALKWVLACWAVMACVDIASQGYIPLLALLRGDFVYIEFKPPLHGLTNALSLAFMCASPYAEQRRCRWGMVAIVAFQIAVVHRGPAFYHVLAAAIAYAAQGAARGRVRVGRYAVATGIAAVVFGLAGSLRQGEDFLVHDAFGIGEEYRWLPGGIVWVLMYLASPTSNLLYNIASPSLTCEPRFWATLSTLVPGPLRNAALDHVPTDEAYLPCEVTGDVFYPGLNVSTGFVQFVIDFGVAGLIVPSLVVGCACLYLARTKFRAWGAMHSLVCVLLVVNLFAPAFNQLSFVVAFVIVLAMGRAGRSGVAPDPAVPCSA